MFVIETLLLIKRKNNLHFVLNIRQNRVGPDQMIFVVFIMLFYWFPMLYLCVVLKVT